MGNGTAYIDGRPPTVALLGVGAREERLLRALPAAELELKYCLGGDRVEQMLDDDELDAVLIATPAEDHLGLAGRALTARKHVFIDEPLALSAQGARGLLRISSAERRVLACGNTFLHSSPALAVKEILDEGEIGELFFISSTQLGDPPAGPGTSLVRELAKRVFAMLLHWLGERPRTVRATAPPADASRPIEVVLNLAFGSGLAASVEVGRSPGAATRHTVLVGSERMAVYDGGDTGSVSFLDHGVVDMGAERGNGDYRVSYRGGDVLPRLPTPGQGPLERALEDFSTAIQEGRDAIASVRLAKEVMQVVEAAEESIRRGGAGVSIRPSRLSRRGRAERGVAVG